MADSAGRFKGSGLSPHSTPPHLVLAIATWDGHTGYDVVLTFDAEIQPVFTPATAFQVATPTYNGSGNIDLADPSFTVSIRVNTGGEAIEPEGAFCRWVSGSTGMFGVNGSEVLPWTTFPLIVS